MQRHSRTFSILSLLLFFVALAGQTLARSSTPPRPAQDMLTWGETYFQYPTWLASIEEGKDQIKGVWSQPGIIARKLQLQSFKNVPIDRVDSIVDTKYVNGLMTNYDSWNLVRRCVDLDRLIIDLTAKNQGVNYQARFWIWSDNVSWNEVFVAFPDTQGADLETLANTMFKDSPDCPASTKTTPQPSLTGTSDTFIF